ncbi:di-heme oxidoredictase family protein [Thalassoroseus pseudoceratinae]|uniref:di-heme oxidoredictase family protein n=1 Tax=Thalassoroseus pseudoceratinae TaxID=2713176 RepID=UPI001421ED35|nr:di-heme oxidoredictase family protein [Thalassoroseus pseudoceratinae]
MNRYSRVCGLILATVAALVLPRVGWTAQANRIMDIASDGRWLACSNRDNGTVSVIDLQQRKTIREIKVGPKPEGVSFIGDTHQLAVAIYATDEILVLNTDNGTIQHRIEVFDEPYGIVSAADGERIFVTLEYPGQVIEVDPQAAKITRTFDVGHHPRGIALDEFTNRIYITEYLTGTVRAIDLETGDALDEWPGASTDNLARQLVLHPTLPKIFVPHIRSKVSANHGNGSIFPYVTVLDTRTDQDRRKARVPMDSFRGVLVTANPWAGALTPDGSRYYVVFSGTDDIFSCEVLGDDYRELSYHDYFQTGRNPRDVQVSLDGKELYVYNALDFNITVYSTATHKLLGKIPVCENPLSDEIWRGKVLFYSALQPMASRRWIACSSCHPDGDPDGRTWQNPEGLRNTQSLAGMAWTHPIHWSADRDEVQDFEHTIRGQLMQGRGLFRGRLNDSLGATNRGLSKDLDALSAYANTHKFAISPHAKNGLSEAAKRGRDLFYSKETQCANCHSGPFLTDSLSNPNSDGNFVRHDVGTGLDDPTEAMGPKYDTPTLLGVYRTAPYLHHGTAKTLRDVLTTANPKDQHGRTSQLTSAEITDLVEFLKSLPYEDPEPAAQAAGLHRFER